MTSQLMERQSVRCTDDFFDSLKLSLAGISPGTELKRDCLRRSAVASAFEAASTVRPVDLGHGLWAVLRVSADGHNRVLCVHNVTERHQVFEPAAHFGEDAEALVPLVFLGGETTSGGSAERVECELGPHGFVWLGRLGSRTTTGE